EGESPKLFRIQIFNGTRLPHDPDQPRACWRNNAGPENLRSTERHSRADRYGRYIPCFAICAADRAGSGLAQTATASDLDAARHSQRRGGGACRSQWHEGRHEPLPQDRVWAAVVGDRVDRRQYAHAELKKIADWRAAAHVA